MAVLISKMDRPVRYCPVWKMDRGLRRCTCITIRRCLGCHFAAVAADKTIACVQYRQITRRCHLPHCQICLAIDGIILGAFIRVFKNARHLAHLGPVCGRVTTALRWVVTRPLVHRNACARQPPVTRVASGYIGQPSVSAGCISRQRNLQSRHCYYLHRVYSLVRLPHQRQTLT